jgi:hypothetical protein
MIPFCASDATYIHHTPTHMVFIIRVALIQLHTSPIHPFLTNQLLSPSHPSVYRSSFPLPCIAACLCLNASAKPPAMLPLLSRAPVPSPLLSSELTPLPLYPLSLAGLGAGFLPAGRLAGGAGGFGLPGGGGGTALCSER